MKRTLLYCMAMLIAQISMAQKVEWADFVYSIANFNPGMGIVTDGDGNIYTLGEIQDQAIIQGDTVLNQYGGLDLILIKYSPQGTYLWSKVFGGAGADQSLDLAIDDANHIYASVIIQGFTFMSDTTYDAPFNTQVIQFDTASNFHRYYSKNGDMLVDAIGSDVYLAYASSVEKLDSTFATIWIKTGSGNILSFSDYGPQPGIGDIMVGNNGHLVVSGHENDDGVSLFDTLSLSFSAGCCREIFIIGMDTSGAALWAKTLDSSSTQIESSPEVAIDDAGNTYLAFHSDGAPIYFANDTLFNPFATGYTAMLKYDGAGIPQWGIGYYASTQSAHIFDMLINPQQDVVLCGYSMGSGQFGNYTLPAVGIELNPFVAKVSSAGLVEWYKTAENSTTGTSNFQSVALTPGGAYAVTGFYPSIQGGYHIGCYFAQPAGRDILTLVISENQEPVPATGFTILQEGSKILCKDTTWNATSAQWNFGDGVTSSFKEPIHTYTQPGVYNVCLTATNSCGTKQHCETVNIKGIREILSNRGSNAGVTTADIFGGGFTPTSTVLLKNASNPDIVPHSIQFINTGRLRVRFDLTGEPIGLRDVEVTVPGDTVMTLVNGFTITAEDYSLEVVYSGPAVTHTQQWTPCNISIQNTSGMDAVGVPFFFRVNPSIAKYFNLSPVPPQQVPFLNTGVQYLSSNGLSTGLTNLDVEDTTLHSVFYSAIIPLIRANSSVSLPFHFYSPLNHQTVNKMLAAGPLLESAALTGTNTPHLDICFGEFLRNSIEKTFSITVSSAQWNSCFPLLYDSLLAAIALRANHGTESGRPFSMPAVLVSIVSQMAVSGCVTGIPAVLTNSEMESVISKTVSNMQLGTDSTFNVTKCAALNPFRKPLDTKPPLMLSSHFENWVIQCEGGWPMPQDLGFNGVQTAVYLAQAYENDKKLVPKDKCIWYKNSVDPNGKYGEGDNDGDVFEKPGNTFSYTIAFENADTATAPAMAVCILDTLDGSRFDFSTFKFGPVTIGDSLKFEFDEPGFSHINLSSLQPLNSNYLRTEATIDTATGIIRWLFTTVDNTDYQPDTISFNGFLPPNINGTEGTGYVTYEVKVKSTLNTGDTINNAATIIFDSNAPIHTGNWMNVIDITNPQSAVNALPPVTTDTAFMLTWSGSDFISGIKGYGIFVSRNDGPYEFWQATGDTTQAFFTCENGVKYEFFSVAFDNAMNIEEWPVDPEINPDATTMALIGVDEISLRSNFTLSPNPVTSMLTISSQEAMDAIRILDLFGRVISTMQPAAGAFSVNLPTDDFPAGVYFIEVVSGKKSGAARFLKMD